MPVFVRLNRKVGATEQRVEGKRFYEMIIPKKVGGLFTAPKLDNYSCGSFFRKYLEMGETVLVNPNGGWCTLMKSDQIVEMFTAAKKP
jgi:hypothetical protein